MAKNPRASVMLCGRRQRKQVNTGSCRVPAIYVSYTQLSALSHQKLGLSAGASL